MLSRFVAASIKCLSQEKEQEFDVSKMTLEEIQELIDKGVGLEPSGKNKLYVEYEQAGSPDKLRIHIPGGYFWDVIPQPDGRIQIQPIDVKIIYPTDKRKVYKDWDDALKALPKGWLVYKEEKEEVPQQKSAWLRLAIKVISQMKNIKTRKMVLCPNCKTIQRDNAPCPNCKYPIGSGLPTDKERKGSKNKGA
ncbi:MAG: hypothetical protein WC444_04420 [Candidatus Paceibacterota bacterium]